MILLKFDFVVTFEISFFANYSITDHINYGDRAIVIIKSIYSLLVVIKCPYEV